MPDRYIVKEEVVETARTKTTYYHVYDTDGCVVVATYNRVQSAECICEEYNEYEEKRIEQLAELDETTEPVPE